MCRKEWKSSRDGSDSDVGGMYILKFLYFWELMVYFVRYLHVQTSFYVNMFYFLYLTVERLEISELGHLLVNAQYYQNNKYILGGRQSVVARKMLQKQSGNKCWCAPSAFFTMVEELDQRSQWHFVCTMQCRSITAYRAQLESNVVHFFLSAEMSSLIHIFQIAKQLRVADLPHCYGVTVLLDWSL